MRRIALFAHYDRDGIIDDYVIYYLRALTRVADRILFVSDSDLRDGEAKKLDGFAELAFAGRHGEYDFGSWKRAFQVLNYDLTGWDELILANDSCYAPIYPFEGVFERMDRADCDFWSPHNTKINDKFDHLSSYFLVLRRPILEDEDFLRFWECVEPQPDVDAVVLKYERGLSQLLAGKGYRYESLMPIADVGSFLKTDYVHETMHSYRSSWLKVRLLRENPYYAVNVSKALKQIRPLYPRPLIDGHLKRTLGTAKPGHYYYRFFGRYERQFGPFKLTSKVKRNKRRAQARLRWKLYLKLFSVPIFAFVWPGPVETVRPKPPLMRPVHRP